MYAGQPVLVIEQIKPVKIMINVSEPFFGKVKKGMSVHITLDAYGEEVFKGKVARVYPTIDQATHTFQVELSLPNYNERVRPGMFARVTLPYGKSNSVVIPDIAVQKLLDASLSEYEKEVFCLYMDGRTPKQIAKELKRDAKSISNALSRIRAKLREAIGENKHNI